MKWRAFISICLCALLFSACEGSLLSIFPSTNIEFAKAEIHYTKSGGWIRTSKLDIYGNGLACASLIPGSNSNPLDSALPTLDEKERDRIAQLFAEFSLYRPHYTPVKFWTDQDYHTIVFIYENIPDTVSVYDPRRANLPRSLRKLIGGLEGLHERIIQI